MAPLAWVGVALGVVLVGGFLLSYAYYILLVMLGGQFGYRRALKSFLGLIFGIDSWKNG